MHNATEPHSFHSIFNVQCSIHLFLCFSGKSSPSFIWKWVIFMSSSTCRGKYFTCLLPPLSIEIASLFSRLYVLCLWQDDRASYLLCVCVSDSGEVCTWNTLFCSSTRKVFYSVFVFFFFCVFDKEEHPTLLQLDNGRRVVLCFYCVSVSVSVSVWQGGTLEHLPLQQLDNGGGREEGIEWLANQLTAPGCC